MSDILFHGDGRIFSCRAAGILIRGDKILLQKPLNDAHAFPGGHVSFGETGAETIIREFREESGADIEVEGLKWIEENFFTWGDKSCHQICLTYLVKLKDTAQIPADGRFIGREYIEGDENAVYFHWISLDELRNIEIYPPNTTELLNRADDGVLHILYREDAHA